MAPSTASAASRASVRSTSPSSSEAFSAPRGAHERLVLAGARPGAAPRPRAGRARPRRCRRSARAAACSSSESSRRSVEDRDRHVAHLAAPAHRHEQRGGRVEALDEVLAHLDAGARRRRRASGASVATTRAVPGRPAVVEHLDVAGVLAALVAHHVRVAGAGALGDLDQQHLVDAERLVQRGRQRRVDLARGPSRPPRRGRAAARHAATAPGAGSRWTSAVRGSGDRVGNGVASLGRGFRSSIGRPRSALDAANRPRCGSTPRQQAPGFCAQKSSNCCASEPAGGGRVVRGRVLLRRGARAAAVGAGGAGRARRAGARAGAGRGPGGAGLVVRGGGAAGLGRGGRRRRRRRRRRRWRCRRASWCPTGSRRPRAGPGPPGSRPRCRRSRRRRRRGRRCRAGM